MAWNSVLAFFLRICSIFDGNSPKLSSYQHFQPFEFCWQKSTRQIYWFMVLKVWKILRKDWNLQWLILTRMESCAGKLRNCKDCRAFVTMDFDWKPKGQQEIEKKFSQSNFSKTLKVFYTALTLKLIPT